MGNLRRWIGLTVLCLAAAACAGNTGQVETSTTGVSTTASSTTAPATTVPEATSTVPASTTAPTTSSSTTAPSTTTTTTAPSTTTSTTSPPSTTTVPPTTAAPGPTTFEVATGDNFFDPVDIVISVGDAVRWRNTGAVAHTTTSGARPIPSGLWNEVIDVGASYTRTFDTPGTFAYFCVIHVGQNGRVTVNP